MVVSLSENLYILTYTHGKEQETKSENAPKQNRRFFVMIYIAHFTYK